MNSLVFKRSIVINGHKTSVSLEDAFWHSLKVIALGQHLTMSKVVGDIDLNRQHGNLSSAIRLFVLDKVRPHVSENSGTHAAAHVMNSGSELNYE